MRILTPLQCFFTIAVACYLIGAQSCFAQTISPSPRTRTLSAPQDNYFQQVTKGHPYRWFDRDMAVKVLIKPGTGVPDFKPRLEEILRAAFAEWESYSDGKIKFRYVTEGPADITCQFVDTIPKEEPAVAGLTSYQTSAHHIDSAVISLRTSCQVTPLTDEKMHAVCLHEIGHALGLVNHSLDPHDVMYPFLSVQKELSARDIKTMHMLYDFKPPDSILQLARRPQTDPNYPFGHIALSSDEYDTYTKAVVAKLLKCFPPFSKGPWLECNVRCFVDSTGNIFNYRIFEGSTNDAFDQTVLASLLSALPLPPPPAKLRKNQWSKTPIALKFRSDGWVIPYVEPDPNQSDWLQISEEPSPDEMMKDIDRDKNATPKVSDPSMEPWIISVTQKAREAWKVDGSGKTEVIVGLTKDGLIAHLVIRQPSGDAKFDASVLKACMAAEPYPASPDSSHDTTEVNMLFEH